MGHDHSIYSHIVLYGKQRLSVCGFHRMMNESVSIQACRVCVFHRWKDLATMGHCRRLKRISAPLPAANRNISGSSSNGSSGQKTSKTRSQRSGTGQTGKGRFQWWDRPGRVVCLPAGGVRLSSIPTASAAGIQPTVDTRREPFVVFLSREFSFRNDVLMCGGSSFSVRYWRSHQSWPHHSAIAVHTKPIPIEATARLLGFGLATRLELPSLLQPRSCFWRYYALGS